MHTKNSEDKRNKDEAIIKENSFESIFIIGGMVRKEFTRFIRDSICQCRWFSSLKVRACGVENKAGCDVKLGTFEHVFYRPPYSPSAVTSSARIPRWIFASGPRGGRFKGRASALYPISSTLLCRSTERRVVALPLVAVLRAVHTTSNPSFSFSSPSLSFPAVLLRFRLSFLLPPTPPPFFLLLFLLFRFLCWGGVGIFFTFYQSFLSFIILFVDSFFIFGLGGWFLFVSAFPSLRLFCFRGWNVDIFIVPLGRSGFDVHSLFWFGFYDVRNVLWIDQYFLGYSNM